MTTCGCPREFSRRSVLRGGLLAGAVAATAGVLGPDAVSRYAFADAGYSGDVVVVLSLRGGFDGLSVVAPVADPLYQSLRPNIRLTPAQSIGLDRTFAMHPAMAPLTPFWRAGTLGFVHDVGQAAPTRSHFAAMAEMERAAPGSSVRSGWINRALGARSGAGTFAGTQIGTHLSPGLAGPSPVMSMIDVEHLKLNGVSGDAAQTRLTQSLRQLNAASRPEVAAPADAALGALAAVVSVPSPSVAANGARYPVDQAGQPTDLARALREVARLIKARVGLQVACVDWGDWDMHDAAGRPEAGWMHDKLTELSAAMAAFATDLGPLMSGVSMVTLSEFGRRVQENGSGGTDHGHGNLVMMMGGGTVGGRVHGNWRGLASGMLSQGDLPGGTDYRLVLGELLERRTGTTAATVFPGLTGSFLGVTRPR